MWKVLAVLVWIAALTAAAGAAFSALIDATNGTLCDPVPCEGKAGRALILLLMALALATAGAWMATSSRRRRSR